MFRDGKIMMGHMMSGSKPLSLKDLKAKYEKPILMIQVLNWATILRPI